MYIRLEAAARVAGLDLEEVERLIADGRIPRARLRRLGRRGILVDPTAIREAQSKESWPARPTSPIRGGIHAGF
jgi:hypothetical protein